MFQCSVGVVAVRVYGGGFLGFGVLLCGWFFSGHDVILVHQCSRVCGVYRCCMVGVGFVVCV